MVLGFNHNITYKGELFHVQTEDSGVANPHITTVLYRGGAIIGSKKISYADILKMDKLEVIVEELMKEQHKEMMRRLKTGDFDEKAFPAKDPLTENHTSDMQMPDLEPGAALSSTVSVPVADVPLPCEVPRRSLESAPFQVHASARPDANDTFMNVDEALLSFFGPREK